MILSIVIFEDRRIDAEILIYVILYNSHLIGVYGVLLAFDRRQLRDLAVLYDKPALVGVRVKVLFGKFLADFVHVCVLEYRAQSGDVPDYRAVAYRGKLSLILRGGTYADVIKECLPAFEAEHNVVCEVQELSEGDLYSGIALDAINDKGSYDLCMVDGSWMAEFTENGVLANLTELGYSLDEDVIPATTTICYVGDDLYLAPYYGNVTVLLYNKANVEAAGYTVKRGKHVTFMRDGQPQNIRLRSLGEGYSEEELRAVILGTRVHTPRRKKRYPSKVSRPTLISQIEAKIGNGKGAAYDQKLKVVKLKTMAETLLFIQKHDFADFDALADYADAASSRTKELTAKIKAAESRMAEIAVLKTHIINYVKTKDVYAAYRKAGYSKKYLAEHEPDILLHKAAKKAFDEQGLQKLPTVKKLQSEYAELLVQKKRNYTAYRQARDEMRELLKAKANVDRILGNENRTGNTEKEVEVPQVEPTEGRKKKSRKKEEQPGGSKAFTERTAA